MGRLCMAEEVRLLHKDSMLMSSVKDSQIWTEGRERPGKGHAQRHGSQKDCDVAGDRGESGLCGEAVSSCETLETSGNEASQDLFKDLSFNSQWMTTNFQRALFECQTWKMTFS